MPRRSPFVIELSRAERGALEAHRIGMSSEPRSCSWPPRTWRTRPLPHGDLPFQVVSKWRKRFFEQRLAGLEERPRTSRSPVFPPELVVAVKAIACELPARLGLPWYSLLASSIEK